MESIGKTTLFDFIDTNTKIKDDLEILKIKNEQDEIEANRRNEILKRNIRESIDDMDVLTLAAHGNIRTVEIGEEHHIENDNNYTGINIINLTKVGKTLDSKIAIFLDYGLTAQIIEELKRLFVGDKNYYRRYKEIIEREWIISSFINILYEYDYTRRHPSLKNDIEFKYLKEILEYITVEIANNMLILYKRLYPRTTKYNIPEPNDDFYEELFELLKYGDRIFRKKDDELDEDGKQYHTTEKINVIIESINFSIKIYRAYSKNSLLPYELNFNFDNINKDKEVVEYTGLFNSNKKPYIIDIGGNARRTGELKDNDISEYITDDNISLKEYLEGYDKNILKNPELDYVDKRGNKPVKFNTKIVILYICNFIDISKRLKEELDKRVDVEQRGEIKYYKKYLRIKNII